MKTPLVVSPYYHGKGKNLAVTALYYSFLRPLVGKSLAKASLIHCVSRTEEQLLIRHYPEIVGRTVVVRLGVDVREIRECGPVPFDGVLVLYTGSIEKYKNIDIVVRAMQFLPEYHFHIIGQGRHERSINRLITRLRLNDRVKVVHIFGKQIYPWYNASRVWVSLSSAESFGLAALEALAAGKPIIVNEASALAEFGEQFEQVYCQNPRVGPRDLASTIGMACNATPKLQRNMVECLYSFDRFTDTMYQNYQHLVGARRHA